MSNVEERLCKIEVEIKDIRKTVDHPLREIYPHLYNLIVERDHPDCIRKDLDVFYKEMSGIGADMLEKFVRNHQ
jgi:hypothetical protein